MDELVPGAGKQQDALREACEEGQINSMDILLKQRADPNHADESGSSLLRQGCDKGHLELVRLLLHFRADLGFIDSSGCSPLYCACYNGHLELVRILLRQRADPNVSNTRASSTLPWGTQRTSSESRWWTPLTRTCQAGLLEMARLLLTWQADPNRIDRNGLAPLRCACDHGHSELVQLLLDRLADPCIMDDSGLSPFFCVCDRGNLKLAALLLRQHADPNVGDKSGRSPLAWAIENDRLEIAEALLAQKVNPNVIDHLGRTPLTLAQKTGEWNSFLQGLQQVLQETPPTLTPLLLQALQENTPNLTPLLLRALADPNYSSIKEHPLKLAIEKSRVDLVKQYLENRADPNVIPTVPLVHYKWNSEILQLLMEHRAEPNLSTVLEVTTIKVQDRDGGDRCDWTSRGIRPDGSVHITCSPGYLERTLRHLVELNADTSLVLRKEQRAEVLEVLRALRTVRVYCAKSGKLLLQTWAEEVRAPGELFVLIHNGLDGLEDMRPHAYRLALHPVQMERELLMHFLETSATCFAWKFDLLPMSSTHFLQAIISNQHLMNLVGETDVNVWLNLEVVSNNEYLQELLTFASAGDVNAVRWVLERGQRPDETLQDEYVNGYTALHVAAEDDFREVAQVLLEKQADANQTEPNEMCTPLHLAAQCGHAWMVELLVRHGANRAAVDFEGQRAVDLAEEEEEHAAEEGDEVKASMTKPERADVMRMGCN